MKAVQSCAGGRGAPHAGPKGPIREQLEQLVSARAHDGAWLVDAWLVEGRHAGTAWWRDADGHQHRRTLEGYATGDELGHALIRTVEGS